MKHRGCSVIIHNKKNHVLLILRDDSPDIPYPNMWDIPGGHIEDGETPIECIIREMKEEIGTDINSCSLFKVYNFMDRTEYVFSIRMDLNTNKIILTEGQEIRWFSEAEICKLTLAYGFNRVARDFFKELHKRELFYSE